MTSANLHKPSIAEAALLMNVSRRSVSLAAKLCRLACAELVAEVEQGQTSLNLALQIARFDHDSQRTVLQAIAGMPARHRTRMVRVLIRDAQKVPA